MLPPDQTLPVVVFLGVLVQLGGMLMLIGVFYLLRGHVLRRSYFSAWAAAWAAVAAGIGALVVRYILVPGLRGAPAHEADVTVRGLYFVYQSFKVLGLVLLLRGTVMYVAGARAGFGATRRLWIAAVLFAALSTTVSSRGLNEMVIWQSAIGVPILGYCASMLFWLPRSRRTRGSLATASGFLFLAVLWLFYAGAFGLLVRVHAHTALRAFAARVVSLNSYCDLAANVFLGYAMILLLLEDAKREVDDAQSELRITHDQLRRAALYDSLTDSLNRRAYVEGVGLEMVRATFGTVVLADLDNLKLVNDRFGHSAGDRLLRHCADVLRATLRPYDKLYRWGGDEFLLLVPSARAEDVLQRISEALAAEVHVEGDDDQQIHLEVSLGAADYASAEELPFAVEHADRAMYLDKGRRKAADRRSGATHGVPAPPPNVTV
jgi:diguanylate cyclase (GGDEF)-like protein